MKWAARIIAAFSALVAVCALTPGPAAVGREGAAPSQASPDEGQAWILVDADRRLVLDGKNIHKPLAPASAGKLMNAYTVLQRLAIEPIDPRKTNQVVVSPQAANAPRPRLGIGSGGAWSVAPLLNAMLLISANDAASALAETSSGSLNLFTAEMNTQAKRLGMRDSKWNDPLGDDDAAPTPNSTSAWDLAVLTRALLADPQVADTTRARSRVVNGPGLGRAITNQNDFIDRYEGAIGMKQGQSIKAGGGVLVAAANRNNRTLIVVVLGSPNTVPFASSKLDQGFFIGPSAKGVGKGETDRLPPLRSSTVQGRIEALVNLPPVLGRPTLEPGVTGAEANPTPAPSPTTAAGKGAKDSGESVVTPLNLLIALLLIGLGALIFLRRRAVMEQRARRVGTRRTIAEARRRGTIDVLETDQVASSGHVRILDRKEHRERRTRSR